MADRTNAPAPDPTCVRRSRISSGRSGCVVRIPRLSRATWIYPRSRSRWSSSSPHASETRSPCRNMSSTRARSRASSRRSRRAAGRRRRRSVVAADPPGQWIPQKWDESGLRLMLSCAAEGAAFSGLFRHSRSLLQEGFSDSSHNTQFGQSQLVRAQSVLIHRRAFACLR